MTKLRQQWRQALVALLGISLGAFAISQTPAMSELGRVFPMTAGLIAIAASLGVLAQIAIRPSAENGGDGGTDYVRAGLFSATMLAWALLLDRVGFVPTSAVAVVLVAVIARRDRMSVRSIMAHAAAGVALILGFSWLLAEVLNVRLP